MATPSLKLAFDTASVHGRPLIDVVRLASEGGFAAIEVFLPNTSERFQGTVLSDPALARVAFVQAGLLLAGVSTHLRFGDAVGGNGQTTADAVRRVVDFAKEARAPTVRFLADRSRRGIDPMSAALRQSEELLAVADHAGAAGVRLLIQTSGAFATATAMWRVMEQIDHPAVCCAWDVEASAEAGEAPGLVVPTLNHRIRHVLLRDVESPSTEPAVISVHKLRTHEALRRLAGIGFDGVVCVDLGPSDTGNIDRRLGESARQLREWIDQMAPKMKKPPAKPAATTKSGTMK